jgi:hypothetical protein
MQRLREIERLVELHEEHLAAAHEVLARDSGRDARLFASRWLAIVEAWQFDEVNDLIDRHNRFFPIESRLPMDPQTGDFVLVDGAAYARDPLDARWALERFPAELDRAA